MSCHVPCYVRQKLSAWQLTEWRTPVCLRMNRVHRLMRWLKINGLVAMQSKATTQCRVHLRPSRLNPLRWNPLDSHSLHLARVSTSHGSGVLRATTASSKPSFTTLSVGDAMVGRRNAGWTSQEWTSLPMPELLMMASHRKDEIRISAESSLMSPDNPIGQRT